VVDSVSPLIRSGSAWDGGQTDILTARSLWPATKAWPRLKRASPTLFCAVRRGCSVKGLAVAEVRCERGSKPALGRARVSKCLLHEVRRSEAASPVSW